MAGFEPRVSRLAQGVGGLDAGLDGDGARTLGVEDTKDRVQ